jgi:chromosome partitioning protein
MRIAGSIYDVLVDDQDLASVVIRDVRPRLDLVGANHTLAGAEVELTSLTRPQKRLDMALEPARGRYDAIVVDCPPSLGLLTVNGLTACNVVVIPVQCEYLALEGLTQLINTVDLVKRSLNPGLDILGLVMTMYDSRTRLATDVVRDVARLFPNRIFRTIIPRTVRLAEAPSNGQSIFEYDAGSKGAEAYQKLGAEIEQRLGLTQPHPDLATDAAAKDAAAFSSIEVTSIDAAR